MVTRWILEIFPSDGHQTVSTRGSPRATRPSCSKAESARRAAASPAIRSSERTAPPRGRRPFTAMRVRCSRSWETASEPPNTRMESMNCCIWTTGPKGAFTVRRTRTSLWSSPGRKRSRYRSTNASARSAGSRPGRDRSSPETRVGVLCPFCVWKTGGVAESCDKRSRTGSAVADAAGTTREKSTERNVNRRMETSFEFPESRSSSWQAPPTAVKGWS
jgi:hypothetical protein